MFGFKRSKNKQTKTFENKNIPLKEKNIDLQSEYLWLNEQIKIQCLDTIY